MKTNNLSQLKSSLLAEFEEIIMPLERMWAKQVKQQEINRWEIMYGFTPKRLREKSKSFLSHALDTVAEKTAEAVLNEAIAIFDKLPEDELMTKNPVILELTALQKWLKEEK